MRKVARLVLVASIVALAGCSEPIEFHAYVDPPTGHVPYAARVVCSPLHGTFTIELPDGTSVTTEENELEVTVDRLEWSAKVTWTNGKDVRVDQAGAQGTNAPPTILAPRLNGDPGQDFMRPRETTLIDFTHYAGSLSGPESGVVYDGAWHIVSIVVETSEKSVCGAIMADSIYTPPYEDGVYHALFDEHLIENACLVYPLLTMEVAPNGRPYAPEPLTGYTYDGARNRNVLVTVEFPEQTLNVVATVEDEWGRRTTASFSYRVTATSSWDYLPIDAPPGAHHDEPTQFRDARFFVSGRLDPDYYRRDCPEVCAIPAADRIYFASEKNAAAAGKKRSPSCFDE